MKRPIVIVAFLVLAFLVACGGEDGWDDDARAEFIAGCESGGGTNEACVCMQEKVEAKFPDPESPDDIPQEEVSAIAQECVSP